MLRSRRHFLTAAATGITAPFVLKRAYAFDPLLAAVAQQANQDGAPPSGNTPTIIGTTTVVEDAGANPSSSVSVPASADYVVVFCSFYASSAQITGMSLGAALTLGEAANTSGSRAYVYYGDVSAYAGTSQTLSATRGAVDEGGALVAVFISDVAASNPVPDTIADTSSGSNDVTGTLLGTTTDDLVVAQVSAYTEGASLTLPTQGGMTWLETARSFNTSTDRVYSGPGAGNNTPLTHTTPSWLYLGGIAFKGES